MSLNLESYLKGFRIVYVAEATYGVPPTNPTWLLYSDEVEQIGGDIVRAAITPQRVLGSANVASFILGSHTSQLALRYRVHDRTLADDVIEDAMVRDADNLLAASHSIMVRHERTLTVGIDSAGTRDYIVAQGGYITSGVLTGQLEPATALTFAPLYQCQRVRKYRIDQPDTSGADVLIGIKSSAATIVTVTIEDEGASVSQTKALAGTVYTSMGVTKYGNIDAIRLASAIPGDLLVSINTGSDATPVEGKLLCTIRGGTFYGADGDLGIPLLGSGSYPMAIATAMSTLKGSTIEWDSAGLADVSVANVSLTVDNFEGGSSLPTAGSTNQSIIVGGSTFTVSAQVVGTHQTHANIDDHLGGTAATFTWKPSATSAKTLSLAGTIIMNPGGANFEIGQGVPVLDIELQGEALTLV